MNINNLLLLFLTLVMSLITATAVAGSTPFIGEIRFVGFNFAPRGWSTCDGQLLAINNYQALYSVLGTTYGGDGRTTFGLPDMRGRTPIHPGTGAGLSSYRLGQKSGTEVTTLNTTQLPSHSHTAKGVSTSARTSNATNNAIARTRSNLKVYDNSVPNIVIDNATVGYTGLATNINNMQPFNSLYCIIALQGTFPSRN
jgi:microcystin-dependent protein